MTLRIARLGGLAYLNRWEGSSAVERSNFIVKRRDVEELLETI
jgi:hypothetical protein